MNNYSNSMGRRYDNRRYLPPKMEVVEVRCGVMMTSVTMKQIHINDTYIANDIKGA